MSECSQGSQQSLAAVIEASPGTVPVVEAAIVAEGVAEAAPFLEVVDDFSIAAAAAERVRVAYVAYWEHPDDPDLIAEVEAADRASNIAHMALSPKNATAKEVVAPVDALLKSSAPVTTRTKKSATKRCPCALGGELPENAAVLSDLPYGLGFLQRWITGRAKYPSATTSGICAFAAIGHLAMAHITVASYGGLGLNEQWMILAPTGAGKEDLRAIFSVLDEHAHNVVVAGANLASQRLPRLQWSAPASPQAIHQLLQKHPAQFFVSDEFAEWLTQASTDSHKQMALGFFMEIYTKSHATVSAPHAVAREYTPIQKPRVGVFATSTAERMLTAMTGAQADSGSYNRFVIHVAEQHRIEKQYDGLVYGAPAEVLSLVDWIVSLPATVMEFAPGAWEFFKQHDSTVIEPLRFSDNVLAARLSEQSIKMAAILALSDRRTSITANDLGVAYAIREGSYRRAATLIGTEGAISGMHATGKALAQLTVVFSKHQVMRRAWLPNYSRAYKGLSAAERNAVVSALLADGTVTTKPDAAGMLFAGDVDVD